MATHDGFYDQAADLPAKRAARGVRVLQVALTVVAIAGLVAAGVWLARPDEAAAPGDGCAAAIEAASAHQGNAAELFRRLRDDPPRNPITQPDPSATGFAEAIRRGMSGQVDMGAVAALRRELAGAEQLWAHVVTAHSGCFAVEEVSRAQGVLAR